MIFQTLASGSNGNASVYASEKWGVLFDAGISRKNIIDGLKDIQVKKDHIKYVCITHAHWDHIRGLPVLMDHLKSAKVVASWETLEEIAKKKKQDPRYSRIVDKAIGLEYDDEVTFKDGLTITTLPTLHDIAGASGFSVQDQTNNFRISYATDTADLSSDFQDLMAQSNLVFLESNHDTKMLEKSRRPYSLKTRIKKTHLSNTKFMDLLGNIHTENTSAIFVGHLSGECNSEQIVYDQMKGYSDENPLNWAICSRYRKSAKLLLTGDTPVLEGGLTNIHDDRTENELMQYFS